MLIDLHAHTSGISLCCKIDAKGGLEEAKKVGIDGYVLTNHYKKSYLNGGTPQELAQRYYEEFLYAKEQGEKLDMRVFFGIEVASEPNHGRELLVYGVEPEFILEHPSIYEYTSEELYNTVKAAGGIVIQAHPYRNGGSLLDVKYLDGVEINCHPIYKKSDSAEMIEIASKERLALTCGGDYHHDTYRCKCGMYIPDSISDGVALGRYIAEADTVKMCIHEPYGEMYDYEFTRTRK